MTLWDELVNGDEQSKDKTEDEKLEPLLDEINEIKDDGIRSFVRSCLLKSELFWLVPSSFSGKYHPPDEHGLGGNVLHTQRVVRVVRFLANSQERDDFEVDLLIAAALLHDISKGMILPDNSVTYDPLHPITAEKFVEEVRKLDEANSTESGSSTLLIEDQIIFTIMRMVRCSHGPWSAIPELIPISQLEWTLHYADYIASNLHNITDKEVNNARWPGAEPLPEAD